MATQLSGVAGPLATTLPSVPSGQQYFTDEQWTTLLSILDTVIPSIRRESSAPPSESRAQYTVADDRYATAVQHIKDRVADVPSESAIDAYLSECPSMNAGFHELLLRTLIMYTPSDARWALTMMLSTLNTRAGSLILTGSLEPFHLQSLSARTAVLNSWKTSYVTPLQAVYKQMTLLAKNLWIKTSPTFYDMVGYPRIPQNYKPGPQHKFDFLQLPATSNDTPEVIETDVLIIGSGCGGSVCAKNIAEAGHKVLVVDKSYHYTSDRLPMTEEAAGVCLFENGGMIQSDDGSTLVIAGSSWGGGGTINWSVSLQTQAFVRKEWAEDKGLKFFASPQFQASLDRVCQRMGVGTDQVSHNHGNRMLLEGSRRLGNSAKAAPQNTGGEEHSCGLCGSGCGSLGKKGPAVSFLPDAEKAGATFMEGFQVEKVLFDETTSGKKKAIGATGMWTSRIGEGGRSQIVDKRVTIKAKKVIVSCGSIWSPIVLLNSGLTNKQIGRNLHVHPVGIVCAVFKEDVRPWEGAILTSVDTTYENLDQHGHGVKLETSFMLPSWCLTFLNWSDGFDYKMQALKYRHSNSYIALTRDRDGGRVYKDPTSGLPRIQYSPSKFDRAHTMEGVIALAKMLYVTDAEEIHVSIAGVEPFIRNHDASQSLSSTATDSADTDGRFDSWLSGVKRYGNAPPGANFGSAHQMGSNRMSATPGDGVVDPKGCVWGTEDLYVADASVFPSASGVNPMVTNMAISDWISRGIVEELARESKGSERVAKL